MKETPLLEADRHSARFLRLLTKSVWMLQVADLQKACQLLPHSLPLCNYCPRFLHMESMCGVISFPQTHL